MSFYKRAYDSLKMMFVEFPLEASLIVLSIIGILGITIYEIAKDNGVNVLIFLGIVTVLLATPEIIGFFVKDRDLGDGTGRK